MTKFLAFALYLCLSASILIVWPLMQHPTLPTRRKILLSMAIFLVLIPIAFALYSSLGVPQMAGD